jgi:predicted RNA binding protein YcfA (HicA-like mRNA interferase family)
MRYQSLSNKTYDDVMSGIRDNNIRFSDLCNLLTNLGFEQRQGSGSHVKFGKHGIFEIIVLQPIGSFTKGYQIKQVRTILKKYRLVID